MSIRENLHYRSLLARLICCLGVSGFLINAAYFGLLSGIEEAARNLVLSGQPDFYGHVIPTTEGALILLMCFLPAVPCVQRPIFMILSGVGCVFIYAWIVLAIFIVRDTLLPITSPLLGLFVSAALLETMAWSEDRSARVRLERLEQMRQQLADMLVHDLKKKTSTLLASFSLLEQKLGQTDFRDRELFPTIRASGERLLMLISNLLDIRKFEMDGMRLRRETLSVKTVVEDNIGEHRAAADLVGITLSHDAADDAAIYGDRQMISRILANLLWNAIQHAPRSSAVRISYGSTTNGMSFITVANRGGIISPEEQQAVFRPFAVAHASAHNSYADSTGLGLVFCKLAAEAHGGSVTVESPWRLHGDGVCVTVNIPSRSTLQRCNAS